MSEAAPPAERIGLARIFKAFFVLGATSFGGGVVAYLREALVVRERWLDDRTFVEGLELAQMLPGLNATNMSVYVGERLRGAPGALVACLGMMLPGTIVVMTLGVLLAENAKAWDVSSVLLGVGSAAVGLLLQTTWRLAKPVILDAFDVAIAAATFAGVSLLRLPLPLVLLVIAPIAIGCRRPRGATPTGAGAATTAGDGDAGGHS
ncbi:chromate transporter [bacterium]|nr:chromate transporter [bacterium]